MKHNVSGLSVRNHALKEQQQNPPAEKHVDYLTYWKRKLDGDPLALDLPTDHPRSSIETQRRESYTFPLSSDLFTALNSLSQQENVSLFTTLLAAFQALLYRYTGQEDFLVGIPAGIPAPSRVANSGPVVLRATVAGNTSFRELLRHVSNELAEISVQHEVPFAEIMNIPQSDSSTSPSSQAMFALQKQDEPEFAQSSLGTSENDWIKTSDLLLTIHETAEKMVGWIEYNSDLFEAATVARMSGHWLRLLEGIAADSSCPIDDLLLLSQAELHQQLVEWNATEVPYPQDQCFHTLFEAQVKQAPEAVAITDGQDKLSYCELNQRANQLAYYLQNLGVGPETIVPLLVERGVLFLTSMLAVFKAGGAYLPLDPHHPPTRLRQILKHSRSRLILAAKFFAPTLAEVVKNMPEDVRPRVIFLEDVSFQQEQETEDVPMCTAPHHLAYVIYTSGSTGTPKGAMIEHKGMLNHIYAKIAALNLTAADAVAQTASQCFDISVWQFLAVLLVGGRVHVFSDEISHDPLRLLAQVGEQQITILETVPSLLRVLLETIEKGSEARPDPDKLRWIIPTGEALPPDFCRRWLAVYSGIPLLNAYGPTECSDDVTHFPISSPLPDRLVHTPIGRPINNMRLYILDRQRRPLPIGVSGELYVGGIGVGRGYLNDPQRTADAFLADPFSDETGARLYKTGDLARYLPDGNIEFLGRIDYQVKIRGYRIELGEIEAILRQHPDVKDVIVVAREDTPGQSYLAVYVATFSSMTSQVLRLYLKENLPDYMVPAVFTFLDALPLTSNGKVDRRALPIPELSQSTSQDSFTKSLSPVHQQLVQIWEELLDVRPIGIQDNFFDLGGHSLLAVRLVGRIEQIWGERISSTALLNCATIEQLALLLEQKEAHTVPEAVHREKRRRTLFSVLKSALPGTRAAHK